jgi:hypothetical protein
MTVIPFERQFTTSAPLSAAAVFPTPQTTGDKRVDSMEFPITGAGVEVVAPPTKNWIQLLNELP